MAGKKNIALKSVVKKFMHGGTPKTDILRYWEGSMPWVTGSDFTQQKLDLGRRYISKEAIEKTSTNVVPQGNLLLLSRTGVGKMTIAPCDIAISQDITGLIIDQKKCFPQYLFCQLEAHSHKLKRWSQGTSIKGIERKDLEIFPIELPKLPAQKRIAALLDSIDTAIEKTRDLIAQQKRAKIAFISSITNSKTLNRSKLADLLSSKPQNGIYCHESLYGRGIRILRIDNFSSGDQIEQAPKKAVGIDDNEAQRYYLREGDLIVNRVNSLSHLGKIALVGNLEQPTIFESNMMRFRTNESKLLSKFALQMLASNYAQRQVKRMAKIAVAQCSIDQTDLQDIIIPVPSLSEQKDMIRFLDLLEARSRNTSNHARSLTRLKTALSQKIFN